MCPCLFTCVSERYLSVHNGHVQCEKPHTAVSAVISCLFQHRSTHCPVLSKLASARERAYKGNTTYEAAGRQNGSRLS